MYLCIYVCVYIYMYMYIYIYIYIYDIAQLGRGYRSKEQPEQPKQRRGAFEL